MKNILIILLLFFKSICFIPLLAQTNISLSEDCLKKNAAIMSQSLIEAIGVDSVTQMLKDQTHIVFICDVDSLGYVLKIKRARSIQKISNNLANDLEGFLITNKKQFFICYHLLPGLSACESYKLIINELQGKNKHTIASISFPVGEWFYLQYRQYLKEHTKDPLSQFEYLQQQINRYLPTKEPSKPPVLKCTGITMTVPDIY